MKISAHHWLEWAAWLATEKQAEWITAMRSEVSFIDTEVEQARFAFGCFLSVLHIQALTKRGLSFISRIALVLFIMVMSLLGIIMGLKMGTSVETEPFSQLVIVLCSFYFIGAILLMRSLKNFTYFAIAGVFAGLVGGYCAVSTGSPIEGIPDRWFTAIFIEMTAIMVIWYAISRAFTALNDNTGRQV